MAMARSGIFYVIDVVRLQGSPFEVERLKAVTAYADAQLTNRRAEILLQQEPGAAGKSYVDAQRRGPLLGFTVEVEQPTGDKYTRALPMSSAAQAGNIKLVRGKWNKDFVDELEQRVQMTNSTIMMINGMPPPAASTTWPRIAGNTPIRQYPEMAFGRRRPIDALTRICGFARACGGLDQGRGDDQIEGGLTIGGGHGDSRSRSRAETGAGQRAGTQP
jgi:predicted phage terminase large subunit-like protein